MKRYYLFLLFVLSQSFAVQAVEVVDDRGFRTTLAHAPQRIVSLLPSLTETICELGYCQRLVGVDRYSNFPLSISVGVKDADYDLLENLAENNSKNSH